MRKWIIGLLNIVCIILIATTKQNVKAFDSTFTVYIPKDISDNCKISIDADLDTYELLKVDVPDKVKLTDEVSNEKTSCYINTDKTSFTHTDIENNIKETNISINDNNVNAGKWKGSFDIDVYISDIPLEGHWMIGNII